MERDYKLLLMIGVLVFTVLLITLVLADVLSTPTTEFNFNEDVSNNYSIIINKSGLGSNVNFTWINITLPNNFTFTIDTNATNSTYLHTFSNMTNASGNVVLMWNSTSGVIDNSTEKTTFSFNATAPNPGNFTIQILTLDNATQENTTSVNVFINDTTYPEITITNPTNLSNLSSATHDLNYTYTEYLPGFCWYSNNSGVTNSTPVTMSTNWTNRIGMEGINNVTVYCNDTTNNINSTMVRFTIDTINPSVSYTCSQTIISHGGSVDCSCSYSDSGSGIETTSSTSPNTLIYGTQTVGCTATDYAGNSASSSIAIHVIQGGGGRSGPSQGYDNTFVEDSKELSEIGEITKSIPVRNRIRIKINNEEHNVGVKELTETTATIEVSSTPQSMVFNIGDENKFDITEDGFYDLKVKLNSITSGKADITITSINEKIPEPKKVLEKTIEQIKQGKSNIWVIIGIIFIVIVVGYFILRKKK